MTYEEKEHKLKNLERLQEIERLGLHNNEVREILDEYVQKASKDFDLPISLVSIVLDDAQHFAASYGLDGWLKEANGTPVEWSFCANSIVDEQPFVVENAETDERVNQNPLVQIDGIRCYAGAPLITKNGYVVGNICVIGDSKRPFSEQDIEKIKQYATRVMNEIENMV